MVPSFLILLTKVHGLTDLHRETIPVAFQRDDEDDVGVLASPLNGFHKAADEEIASNTLVQETYHHSFIPPKKPLSIKLEVNFGIIFNRASFHC